MISDACKAIPSETSVTGHEVSGGNASIRSSACRAVLGYCLPDKVFVHIMIPETSSRVSLALLGNVFQTENCREIYDGK